MSDLFDLSNFDKYKEDNCREVKKAEGGLPIALWESYSSFANSNGGVIILGVGERQDGTWYTTGLKNADKLKRNFWNTIHDTKKVSITQVEIMKELDLTRKQVQKDMKELQEMHIIARDAHNCKRRHKQKRTLDYRQRE